MSTLGDNLIRSLKEAVNHAVDDGPGLVHGPAPQGNSEFADTQSGADGAPDRWSVPELKE